MKKIFVFVAFILFGFTACKKEDVTIYNQDSYLIFYEIASNWTSYSFQATIDLKGKLHIEEENRINNFYRESDYEIPEVDKLIIKRKLGELMSVELAGTYGFENENAPTDLPTKKIKYTNVHKTDSTYVYFPGENELPDELDNFIQVIQQVILENDTVN